MHMTKMKHSGRTKHNKNAWPTFVTINALFVLNEAFFRTCFITESLP